MFIMHGIAHNGYIHWQIGPFQSTKGERAKLKVKVRLNLHGIVSVESATVSFSYGFWGFLFCWRYILNSYANLIWYSVLALGRRRG